MYLPYIYMDIYIHKNCLNYFPNIDIHIHEDITYNTYVMHIHIYKCLSIYIVYNITYKQIILQTGYVTIFFVCFWDFLMYKIQVYYCYYYFYFFYNIAVGIQVHTFYIGIYLYSENLKVDLKNSLNCINIMQQSCILYFLNCMCYFD